MSGTGLWVVQQAVYSTLTGDVTLAALHNGVFDKAPGDTLFPYIDIGDGDEIPFRTFGTTEGHEDFITVRIWTRDDKTKVGFKEGLAIYDRVNVLLDQTSFSVSNHTRVMCNLSDVFKRVEDDGETRQISATYRVILQ